MTEFAVVLKAIIEFARAEGQGFWATLATILLFAVMFYGARFFGRATAAAGDMHAVYSRAVEYQKDLNKQLRAELRDERKRWTSERRSLERALEREHEERLRAEHKLRELRGGEDPA